MLAIAQSKIPANFKGTAKRLEEIDIPRIASLIDVSEDKLRALIEVESRGQGFDRLGRPVILFEPHVFWKLLGKGAKRDRAVRASLAYPNWGEKPYPKDSYPRLMSAMEIDRSAALQSASWGLPQIMGMNYRLAGFLSVETMVAAFCADEENHLEAMVRFLKSKRLDDELREHRWEALARGYNGPGYAKHGYHTRLARAYAKWQKKPDIDLWEAAKKEALDADADLDALRNDMQGADFADKARIKAIQQRLSDLGYHMVGKPDGIAGVRTAGAIAAFQKENGLEITGEISTALIAHLETAHPLEVSPARAQGKPEKSRIIEGGKETAVAGGSIGITGAIAAAAPLLDQVEQAKSMLERAKELVAPVQELAFDYWPLIALGVGAWLVWRGIGIVRARIEDHQSGRTA